MDVDLNKWLDISKTNSVALAMKKAALDIDSVVTGRSSIAIISGAPGVGKSYLLHDCAARMKQRNIETNFVQFTNVRDLDDAIYEARGRSLIVADEADSLLRSIPQIERLKLLADPTYKDPLRIGAGKHARTLQLTCPIILAFNADIDVADRATRTQLDALFSRQRPVRVSGSKKALHEYSVMVALTTNLLKNYHRGGRAYGGSLESFSEAIDFFTENMWNLEEVSPRSLQKIYFLICEHRAGQLSFDNLSVELHSLLSSGPPQTSGLPQLEDWGALRRAYIALENQKKNIMDSPILLLPPPQSPENIYLAA